MREETLIYLTIGVILAIVIFYGGETFMEPGNYEGMISKYFFPIPIDMNSEDFRRLIHAVIQVESNWNPDALSSAGAIGLMQVMPANATAYGYQPDQLYDPEINIDLGIRILRENINIYGLKDGLAAYNGGPSKRHITVTQQYAQKVLRQGGFV